MKTIKYKLMCSIFVLFYLSACTDEKSTQGSTITASPGASFELTVDQINALKQKAIAGDYAAASRLADHYTLADPKVDESIRWLRVMAESGDLQAKSNLATHISLDISRKSCIEAEKLYLEVINQSNDNELITYAKLSLTHLRAECKNKNP